MLMWACARVSTLRNLHTWAEMPEMMHPPNSLEPSFFFTSFMACVPPCHFWIPYSIIIITPAQTPAIQLHSLCCTCLTKPQAWLNPRLPMLWAYSWAGGSTQRVHWPHSSSVTEWNLWINFGSVNNLILQLPGHESGISLHLFKWTLINSTMFCSPIIKALHTF